MGDEVSIYPVSICAGFGGGVITSTGTQYNQARFRLSPESGEVDSENVDSGAAWSSTKDEVLSMWGQPDEITTIDDESTKWIYHRELAWHGIVVLVIVPIPLVIPFGSRNTEVIFAGDLATSILYHKGIVAPYCDVSLFDVSLAGLEWWGVHCDLKKRPWVVRGQKRNTNP